MTAVAYNAQDVLWQPHSGPQRVFLASDAYEALYGGAAGGGKSDALLFGGLRQIAHPSYKALLLRRTFPELTDLMDRAHAVFRDLGGEWHEQRKRYTFPSGATYAFGYCESYKDVLQYQGKEFTYIGFDELGQVAEERIWTYLISRNRSASPGLVRQMRASANPGGAGHQWIKRRFITPCPPSGVTTTVTLRDGTTATRAFVQAFLSDNPTLLEYDPGYAQRLSQLPELEYRWLALGDWDAGAGLGLAELSRKHVVEPFAIPEHWQVFGAFDWGYAHPFAFGLFATDEDGTVYLVDSVSARRLQPPEIAERILALLETHDLKKGRLRYTAAGHDCWADVRARAEHVPTIAEHFLRLGVTLIRANISRVSGVQNIRRYLAGDRPQFLICDTPANQKAYACLETRVSDPDDPEDILKTDADENGEGGDDLYDMVRYGLASRPIAAKGLPKMLDPDRAAPRDLKTGKAVKPSAERELQKVFKDDAGYQRAARHKVPRW